jgi:uncharacterized protein (TIGR03083 family)
MSDPDLGPLLRAMDQTWTSILELAESLAPEEFALPTRCPGWDVHDQIAHVVSVEQLLAGGPLAPEAPPAAYIRNEFGAFMERGVHALRGTPPDELVDLLRAAIAARRAALQADPPKVGSEVRGVMGNLVPAERSLPIRVFDLWAHDQDVRAAVGRPGNESGLGAEASRDAIVGMLPMHWAKAAEAAAGDVLVVRVRGGLDFDRTVVVADDGRAELADPAVLADSGEQEPTAAIELAWTDLVARACGREGADGTPVLISGDATMARAVVEALPMSP